MPSYSCLWNMDFSNQDHTFTLNLNLFNLKTSWKHCNNNLSTYATSCTMLRELTRTFAYSTCWFFLGKDLEVFTMSCLCDTNGDPRLGIVVGDSLQCLGSLIGGLLSLAITNPTLGVCGLLTLCIVKQQWCIQQYRHNLKTSGY